MFSDRRAAIAAAINAKPDIPVKLSISPSMEHLRARLEQIEGCSFLTVSQETQQLEESMANAVERGVVEAATAVPSAPTIPTIYVISGKGIVDGTYADQSLLRNAVKQKLDTGADVAVALLPSDSTEVEVGDDAVANDGLVKAARQFVSEVDIPVLESFDAINDFIQNATK